MIDKDDFLGQKLFPALESTEAELSEVASQFPKSREEYMAFDVKERMRTAMSILERYANNTGSAYRYGRTEPSVEESAPVSIETSEPGVVAEARVEYVVQSHMDIMRTRWERRVVSAWVSLVDQNKGIATPFQQIGLVVADTGLGRMDGTPSYRAHHAYYTGSSLESGSEPAKVVSIIDEAVCGLIDRIISRHQKLGQAVVETAS